MKISLELEQSWDTAGDLREYLGLLERTLQRVCEMEAEVPSDWFFLVDGDRHGEYRITLTHL